MGIDRRAPSRIGYNFFVFSFCHLVGKHGHNAVHFAQTIGPSDPISLVSLCLATKGSFLALKRCRMGSYRGSRTYVLGGFTMLLRKSPRPSNRINKVGAGAVWSGRNSLLPWSLRRGTFMRCDCSWLSTICRAIDRPAGSKRLCAMDNG